MTGSDGWALPDPGENRIYANRLGEGNKKQEFRSCRRRIQNSEFRSQEAESAMAKNSALKGSRKKDGAFTRSESRLLNSDS
jgi:hypothetical protein